MAMVTAALCLCTSVSGATRKAPDYQVGIFSSTGRLSDGSFAQCSGRSCAGWNAGHNVHYVTTDDGIYAIEAPVSLGKSMLLGVLTDGMGPQVHQQWFMDQLNEGDKVLFTAKCNKHFVCIFKIPNPDKPDKQYTTIGNFRPRVAKTNTTALCGTGKLSAALEEQLCTPK
jgi:hypothetical protein